MLIMLMIACSGMALHGPEGSHNGLRPKAKGHIPARRSKPIGHSTTGNH